MYVLRKSLTDNWTEPCSTFSKFSFYLNDALNKGVPRLLTITGASSDAVASVTKAAKISLSPSMPDNHRFGAAPGPSSFVSFDIDEARTANPFAKPTREINVFERGDLEATDINSDRHALELSLTKFAPSLESEKAFSAATKRVTKATIVDMFPWTWNKPAPINGRIKDAALLL